MFKGFQLDTGIRFDESYIEVGKEIYNDFRKVFSKAFTSHFENDGIIDASKLECEWFPQVNADIFISHSSKDKEVMYGFTGWLYKEMKLKAFVDSAVWGNSTELLKNIDNKYCRTDDGEYYSYSLRNHSTSHVHMMLSSALTKMIDNTECIIFYNSPNSIPYTDGMDSTFSPWIYSELIATQVLRRNVPNRDKWIALSEQKSFEKFAQNQFPDFKYNVSLDHLTRISAFDLHEWQNSNSTISHPLDVLYSIVE